VNLQVTVLKILVSYPDGFALMAGSNVIWRYWQLAGRNGQSAPNGWRRACLTWTFFPKGSSSEQAVAGE
jgi:hypothetical protein